MENPQTDEEDHRITLNVGGKLFETTTSTLRSGGPDSLLYALSSSTTNTVVAAGDKNRMIFIDRDPDTFSALLSLLRSGHIPSSSLRRLSHRQLLEDASFYGLDALLLSFLYPPPFSSLSSSLSSCLIPPSHPFPSSISPSNSPFNSPDVALAVAHGGLITSYDWSLSPSSTLRTHLDDIDSLHLFSPSTVAIASSSPGLHFYDLSSSLHISTLLWTDPSDPRLYKSRVVAIASTPSSVIASFLSPHRENSVLFFDKSTLQFTSQFPPQSGASAKSIAPTKLSFLPQHQLVFGSAISSGAFGYAGYVRLWDVRSGDVVWETNEPGSGRSSRYGDPFADADVDTEESAVFKVCSKSGDVAVADLRKLGEDPWVYLEDKNPRLRNWGGGEGSVLMHCYKKQVFVSRESGLEVWSQLRGKWRKEEVEQVEENSICERVFRRNLVDKEEDSNRGVINMMAGGGNRLFICREGVEGVEVWESSNSSGAILVK